MSSKKRKRVNGFTLVELIVALVILAILAAIMVPALLGWIERAKNQGAILECRSTVQATQGQVATYYGQNKSKSTLEAFVIEMNKGESLSAIKENAGVAGTIYNTIKLDERYLVFYLEYETEAGAKVIFDRTHNPVYRIVDKKIENKGSNGKEYYDILLDSMIKDGYLKNGVTTEELKKLIISNNFQSNNLSKVLQAYYKDKVGDGESYPELTKQEKEKLKKQMLEAGFTNNDGYNNLNNMSWRPVVTTDGNVILTAAVGNKAGGANGSVIYYNGNYYCFKHSFNGGLSTGYVSDVDFSTTNLENNSQWVNIGSMH